MRPHGLYFPRAPVSHGILKQYWVGCNFLLQETFLTQNFLQVSALQVDSYSEALRKAPLLFLHVLRPHLALALALRGNNGRQAGHCPWRVRVVLNLAT